MFNLFFFSGLNKGKKCIFFGFKWLPPKMGLGLVVLRKCCQLICSWSCLAHAGMSQMFSRAEAQRLVALPSCSICLKSDAAACLGCENPSVHNVLICGRGLGEKGHCTALCLIDEGLHFRSGNAKIHKPLDPGALVAQVYPSSSGTNRAGAVGAEPCFF